MLLTTYLPQDQEVHSWLSQELRGNKHTFSFGRKWTDRFQSSCIHQKYVPGKWCCSRGNFTSIIFMRREWPQEKKKNQNEKQKTTYQQTLVSQICFWIHFRSQFYGPTQSQWSWFEVWEHFYPKALCFQALKKRKKSGAVLVAITKRWKWHELHQADRWTWYIHSMEYYLAWERK